MSKVIARGIGWSPASSGIERGGSEVGGEGVRVNVGARQQHLPPPRKDTKSDIRPNGQRGGKEWITGAASVSDSGMMLEQEAIDAIAFGVACVREDFAREKRHGHGSTTPAPGSEARQQSNIDVLGQVLDMDISAIVEPFLSGSPPHSSAKSRAEPRVSPEAPTVPKQTSWRQQPGYTAPGPESLHEVAGPIFFVEKQMHSSLPEGSSKEMNASRRSSSSSSSGNVGHSRGPPADDPALISSPTPTTLSATHTLVMHRQTPLSTPVANNAAPVQSPLQLQLRSLDIDMCTPSSTPGQEERLPADLGVAAEPLEVDPDDGLTRRLVSPNVEYVSVMSGAHRQSRACANYEIENNEKLPKLGTTETLPMNTGGTSVPAEGETQAPLHTSDGLWKVSAVEAL
jgi:hypothetical protein